MAKVDEKKAQEVLERVERERGFARLWPKLLAERDPELLEILHNEVTHVLDHRNSLPRKTKEIIMMCLNAFSLTRHYTVADGKDGRERMTRGGLLQMMSSIRNSNASERISCRSKLGRDPVSIMGMELGRVG